VTTRPAAAADLGPIARLHTLAFRGFFLTKMGLPFLIRYYRTVLEYEGGLLLVAEASGSIAGFVAGFSRPAAFYRLLRRRAFSLAVAMAPALLRHPPLIPRAIADFKRTGGNRPKDDECWAELSSVAVNPAVSGQGIGHTLVKAFVRAAAKRGAAAVRLTTDAVNNEAVNRFYRQLGFELTGTFEATPGRYLNELRITAPAGED
jgi:ribosomal protein S18 acetylase RimI-like enzyme